MQKVTSKDGTPIAYERSGDGPALILVGGALSDRTGVASLVPLLAGRLTVFAYDRRGRGDSGDTPPYAVEREVDDIEALIGEAGGSAALFGHSSGAVLALEAAHRLPSVARLALYEPPFLVDRSRSELPPDYGVKVSELLQAGRRGDAVEHFMTVAVGVPAGVISQMRQSPMWPSLERNAHTLLYDRAVMGDTMEGKPLPAGRWRGATMPALVMNGGASPKWFETAADQLAKTLPHAIRKILAGQNHGADPAMIAPVLLEFFGA